MIYDKITPMTSNNDVHNQKTSNIPIILLSIIILCIIITTIIAASTYRPHNANNVDVVRWSAGINKSQFDDTAELNWNYTARLFANITKAYYQYNVITFEIILENSQYQNISSIIFIEIAISRYVNEELSNTYLLENVETHYDIFISKWVIYGIVHT